MHMLYGGMVTTSLHVLDSILGPTCLSEAQAG